MTDFADFGLSDELLRGVRAAGFGAPTDIQAGLIPAAMGGRDVVGQARTGTGKTAAFALPMMQGMASGGGLRGMVVVPTRELALQVTAEFRSLGRFTGLAFATVYGGASMGAQVAALRAGADVVVATPGRLLDLMRRGALDASGVRFVVLDEVDRMLDIGFIDDVRRIMRSVPRDRRTVLVSATVDGRMRRLAREFASDPVEIDVSQDELTVGEVKQVYCTADEPDKGRLLLAVVAQERPARAIVFTNMRVTARRVTERLNAAGVPAEELHGDLDQARRERVMGRFRAGKIRILVATDVAARGIDVAGITHIVNYDFPTETEVYVHRIGRTARMGASGKAVTFVSRDEGQQLTEVEKLIDAQIEEVRYEGFKPSPRPEQATAPPPKADVASDRPPMTLGSKFRRKRRRRL
jgi:superfamily II DNA/RNA helicase